MRYSMLDGMRGIFLILMMYGHAQLVLKSQLGRVSHHDFSLADAAHGFVFLSGLVVGIYFTRTLREQGGKRLVHLSLRRVWLIYKYHVGVLLALACVGYLLSRPVGFPSMILEVDGAVLAAIALLVYQPTFFDILPMYVVFIALTPLVVGALQRGYTSTVLTLSICFWFISQTGFTADLTSLVDYHLSKLGLEVRLGLFNLFAWQFLYVSGILFGHRTAVGRFNIHRINRLPSPAVLSLAAAFVAIALLMRSDSLPAIQSKWTFSLAHVASTAINAVLISWLYVAGPSSSSKIVAFAAKYFRALTNSRALVMLGRNSIQVFTFHLFLVYCLSELSNSYSFNEPTRSVLLVISTLALLVFAAILNWGQSIGRNWRAIWRG